MVDTEVLGGTPPSPTLTLVTNGHHKAAVDIVMVPSPEPGAVIVR